MVDGSGEAGGYDAGRLLAAVVESLGAGTCIVTGGGRLLHANGAHAKLFGYDAAERPLPRISDFLPDPAAWARMREESRVLGDWSGVAHMRRRGDATLLEIDASLALLEAAGDEPLYLLSVRSAHDELEPEEVLRRTRKLARLGTLIAAVAHELNNPLHAIQGFAELLVTGATDDQVRSDLMTIRGEAQRAARIVGDLRLLARSTEDRPQERTRVDVNRVVLGVLDSRRHALRLAGVEARADLGSSLPPVLGDRAALEQVLLNLVVNAEQAMRDQPGTRLLIVRTRPTESGLGVQVVDSGPGIPGEQLERIFDRFWTTKAFSDGMGLGLAIARDIVQAHGGAITVESEPGKGTAFRFHLPAHANRTEEIVADPGPPIPAKRPLRVLVVDDEPAIRSVLSRWLQDRGHEPDLARHGQEAMVRVEQAIRDRRPYDVIVADLLMPHMSGRELFDRVRERWPGVERSIVFITGDSASGGAARSLQETGCPVLLKPIGYREATLCIEAHAEANREVA